MDNFNKVISFVLGLVVVIVFFAVVTGRINLGKYTPFFAKKPTPTPTIISSVKTEEKTTVSINNNHQYQIAKIPSKIPSSGLPTFFIPSLLTGIFGGSYLRKAGKK